jgi:hypothetical protein
MGSEYGAYTWQVSFAYIVLRPIIVFIFFYLMVQKFYFLMYVINCRAVTLLFKVFTSIAIDIPQLPQFIFLSH